MKYHIVIVRCNWTTSEYVYPRLLTLEDAKTLKSKLTDVNNDAFIKKVDLTTSV
jgi:hypothetical protein